MVTVNRSLPRAEIASCMEGFKWYLFSKNGILVGSSPYFHLTREDAQRSLNATYETLKELMKDVD